MFLNFFSGGHQAKLSRPVESRVKQSKLRHAFDVRIPDAAVAHKEDAVSGVTDYVAAISQSNAICLTGVRRLRQKHRHHVIAVLGQLVAAEVFILEKIERVA